MNGSAFLEGLGNGLLFPLSGEPLFFAMKEFGAGRDELMPVALAVTLGFTLAQVVNWALGAALIRLRRQHKARFHISDANFTLAVKIYWLFMPLLFFAWYSLGSMLVVIAGFLRKPLWLVLLVTAVGKVAYFGYYLGQ